MAASPALADDLALRYDLLLSVDVTQDPHDMAQAFIAPFVERTALDYAAIWMREKDESMQRVCAPPDAARGPGRMALPHPLLDRLSDGTPLTLHATDPALAAMRPELDLRRGAFAAVPLGDLGFIELVDTARTAPFSADDLAPLAPVFTKLHRALQGGRAHRRLLREVDERRRAEDQVRRSQSRLSTLIQSLQDAVLVENEDREVLLANRAFCDLFEIEAPPSELKGADCVAAAHAAKTLFQDPTVLTDRVDAILERGDAVTAETLHRTDGRIIERSYVPIQLGGQALGHLWTYCDVTAQRRASARLREREQAYRQLVESASDLIYRCDLRGRFTYVNPVAVQKTGYIRPDLLGRHYTTLVREDHRADVRAFYRRQIRDRVPDTHREFPIVTADGEEIWLSQRVQLVREAGTVVGVQAVARDATARWRTEQALRAREERFRTMFEKHSAPMLLINPESGAIFDANASALAFYGYSDEAMRSMTIQDINQLPPEEVARRRADAEAGARNRFVFPHRLQSGAVRTVEVYSTPITVQGESLLFSILHDITARKQAEARLRRSEERWRRLVESHRDPIVISIDGVIRYINPAGADTFGAGSPDDLIGTELFAFAVDPEIRDTLRTRNARLQQGQPTTPLEHTIERADGTRRTIVSYSLPVNYEGQRAAQTVIHDVTEEREAESALRHLTSFYEQVFNSMPIDLAIFDPEGRYQHVNSSAVSDPDRRKQMIGMDDVEYAQWRGHDVERARGRLATLHRVARTREAEQFEETVAAPDGTTRHFIRFVTPVVQDDEVVQVLGYGMEITQRKRVEKALRAAKRQAEASLAAKERFLATMSHEIRTPLNAVLGMAHLLAESELTDAQRSYLDSILFSGRTLLTLLDTVLDFARVDNGDIALEPAPFAPTALARRVCDMFRSKAAEKDVALTVDLSPSVPDQVVGDAARVGQILTNLVSNALKFTDAGSIQLSLAPTAPPDDAPGPRDDAATWLALRVSDTGIGIAPEEQERIFDDFARADAPDVHARDGVGLGLAIVHRLLKAMGGTIEVDSAVGVGSTFTLRLPFAPVPSAETEAPSPAASAPRSRRAPSPLPAEASRLDGARILVADDNAINQVVARDLLRHRGARVDVVDDGAAAVRAATNTAYDAILMDVQMPQLDGLEATRRLRQQGLTAPIIALTASMLEENRQQAFDAGMDAFVRKPFTPDALYRTVATHLRSPDAPRSAHPETVPADEAPPDDAPLVDLSFLRDNLEDPATVRTLAETFIGQAATFIEDVTAARTAGDGAQIKTCVHWMKSSSRMVGARQLAHRLQALEAAELPYDDDALDAALAAARTTRTAMIDQLERDAQSG